MGGGGGRGEGRMNVLCKSKILGLITVVKDMGAMHLTETNKGITRHPYKCHCMKQVKCKGG